MSTEIYKFLNGLSPSIMSNVFKQNQSIPYDPRNFNTFRSTEPNSKKYGTEAIYLSPKIWSITPEAIKTVRPWNRLN